MEEGRKTSATTARVNVTFTVSIVTASAALTMLVFSLTLLLGSKEIFGLFDISAVERAFYSLGGNVSMVFYTTMAALLSVVCSFVTILLCNRVRVRGTESSRAGASIISLIAVTFLFLALAIDVVAFAYKIL